MKSVKTAIAAAAVCGCMLAAGGTASAAPTAGLAGAAATTKAAEAGLTKVHWYGRRYWGGPGVWWGWRHRHWGWGHRRWRRW